MSNRLSTLSRSLVGVRTAGIAFLLLLAVFLLCEVLLRLLGYAAWNPAPASISIIPGGSAFLADPLTGYRHHPGQYEVTIGGLQFNMTHDAQGRRLTAPGERNMAGERPEIWIFGGSFTHGWGVNDDQTFPWLLQESLPQYRMVNYGVSGYGTLLSLLQLRREISAGSKPAKVVLAYLYFHDQRNVFSRERRKTISGINHLGPLSQPRVEFGPEGSLINSGMAEVSYLGLPGIQYSAAVNLLDDAINRLERILLREREVTLALFREFDKLADEQGFDLVVAGLSPDRDTQAMLRRLDEEGVTTINAPLEFWDPRFNNLPWDSHPNAAGQRKYAVQISSQLKSLMAAQSD